MHRLKVLPFICPLDRDKDCCLLKVGLPHGLSFFVLLGKTVAKTDMVLVAWICSLTSLLSAVIGERGMLAGGKLACISHCAWHLLLCFVGSHFDPYCIGVQSELWSLQTFSRAPSRQNFF